MEALRILDELEYRIAEVRTSIELLSIRLTVPMVIKGDTKLGDLIFAFTGKRITSSGIKHRVERGHYVEGVHYQSSGGKMRLWNREAVIEFELQKREAKDETY